MVKIMHQNGLHDILPVLYKVASILATIPATSCSAERSFSALRRIKTFLSSTMGQDRLTSIAVVNIERKYANKTMQNDMQRIIDIIGHRSNRSSYFFQSSNGYALSLTSWFGIVEMLISIYRKYLHYFERPCSQGMAKKTWHHERIILCICNHQVSFGQTMFSPPPQQNFSCTPMLIMIEMLTEKNVQKAVDILAVCHTSCILCSAHG